MSGKKMTEEEKIQWDNLYKYVRSEILKYEDTKPLPRRLVLRLKGLADGKFIVNNKVKSYGEYSFELILTTFKYCKFDILRGMKSIDFKDDSHLVNYIMLIIENNINTVSDKLRSREIAEEKANNIELTEGTKLKYKKKSKDKINEKLKDLI